MTDPVAEAAAQLAATPSSTEPSLIDEIKAGIHTLEEKAEHLIHPQSAEVAQVGESAQSAEENVLIEKSTTATQSTGNLSSEDAAEQGNVAASSLTSGIATTVDASSSETGSVSALLPAEHPHTTILRRLTTTLRRKWNMFDGELEAIIKDAESHL
ncbi:hypothetical protein [Paraburkholderia saeva]|uniref:Uncharacterized protein n=1 Tax=Paraburkholderia saeva TaxID=2777537 RepID=A0A9N8X3C2_9BURK|nr:hypothetical protein [Paraburkholderia saeva]CAG4900668.1 hypothetical protein LMG31841_02904 [Paraburkholderia saeva]